MGPVSAKGKQASLGSRFRGSDSLPYPCRHNPFIRSKNAVGFIWNSSSRPWAPTNMDLYSVACLTGKFSANTPNRWEQEDAHLPHCLGGRAQGSGNRDS